MYVIILLLSATMPCTSIAVVMIGPSKERYVISTLVPFHRETERARLLPYLLSFPSDTIGSLAFEPSLIITTPPDANNQTSTQIRHVFNITLQSVPDNLTALIIFHFVWRWILCLRKT